MTYLEKFATRSFRPKEEILMDANEVQRLVKHALALETKCASLEFKVAALEIEAERKFEKVRLYA